MDAGDSSTKAAELTLTEHLCPSFLKLRFPNTLSLVSSSVCLSVFNQVSDCYTVVLLSFNVTLCSSDCRLTLLWVSMWSLATQSDAVIRTVRYFSFVY